jgi:hypothetical protein
MIKPRLVQTVIQKHQISILASKPRPTGTKIAAIQPNYSPKGKEGLNFWSKTSD